VIGNCEGSLIIRKDWALKAEKFEFLHIVKNRGSSLFEGELFASASNLIVFRNSFVRFVDISEQSIVALQDSSFDYPEDAPIFKVGGSQRSMRWKNCVFDIRAFPSAAKHFDGSNACFAICPDTDILSELEETLGWWDYIAREIASNPHALGGVIAVGTILVILVFAYSRNRMMKRMGYGQPQELDSFIGRGTKKSGGIEPGFEPRLPDIIR
jgi:hypothetical protein